jgi:hypothetical protein
MWPVLGSLLGGRRVLAAVLVAVLASDMAGEAERRDPNIVIDGNFAVLSGCTLKDLSNTGRYYFGKVRTTRGLFSAVY